MSKSSKPNNTWDDLGVVAWIGFTFAALFAFASAFTTWEVWVAVAVAWFVVAVICAFGSVHHDDCRS